MDWRRFGREVGLYVIATMVILALVWCSAKLFNTEVPVSNRDMIVSITSFLLAKASTIVDYFFGSSKGSSDKTDALTEQAKQV